MQAVGGSCLQFLAAHIKGEESHTAVSIDLRRDLFGMKQAHFPVCQLVPALHAFLLRLYELFFYALSLFHQPDRLIQEQDRIFCREIIQK